MDQNEINCNYFALKNSCDSLSVACKYFVVGESQHESLKRREVTMLFLFARNLVLSSHAKNGLNSMKLILIE